MKDMTPSRPVSKCLASSKRIKRRFLEVLQRISYHHETSWYYIVITQCSVKSTYECFFHAFFLFLSFRYKSL